MTQHTNGFNAFFPPTTNGQRAERELITALRYEINQAVVSLDAADIGPGKLHERVHLVIEELLQLRWKAAHYRSMVRGCNGNS